MLSVLCLSVCVCVSLSRQRYETARTSTVDHGECPAIKPPTFCLLLRALDRGRPRTMDRAQSSNWGFRGASWTTSGAPFESQAEMSTFAPDVVG